LAHFWSRVPVLSNYLVIALRRQLLIGAFANWRLVTPLRCRVTSGSAEGNRGTRQPLIDRTSTEKNSTVVLLRYPFCKAIDLTGIITVYYQNDDVSEVLLLKSGLVKE
jgi:hypothetical protein